MAVTKLWKVNDRLDHVIGYAENPDKTRRPKYSDTDWQALKDVLEYAKDEEKTEQQFFVTGINCNADHARDQFVAIKQQYNKTDGIQAYHGYLSFKDTDNISPEQAHQIGVAFAEKMWGERFQVVVTTHLNTKCLHCHFVINSVSLVDGKRLQNKEKAWFYFRHIADKICREHNLSVIQEPQTHIGSLFLTRKDKAGIPTRYNLARSAIDEAIEHSRTMTEFKRYLSSMGYKYKISPNLKYWTVTPLGWERPIRLYRLGADYTNTCIQQRIEESDLYMGLNMKPFQKKQCVPFQYFEPRKVKGSLYNLYLYYCYRLGYFNKPKEKQNMREYNRLPYLLRKDLMKLDQYSQEAELLGKHHIDTSGQLFSYTQSVENEIKTLTEERKHLRNKIRRRNTSEVELWETKAQISEISDRLKTLRRELSLCKDIAERSGVIEKNVEQILAEEEKQKGKEVKRNEQLR